MCTMEVVSKINSKGGTTAGNNLFHFINMSMYRQNTQTVFMNLPDWDLYENIFQYSSFFWVIDVKTHINRCMDSDNL